MEFNRLLMSATGEDNNHSDNDQNSVTGNCFSLYANQFSVVVKLSRLRLSSVVYVRSRACRVRGREPHGPGKTSQHSGIFT